ncbi:MAG: GNAT family N-acetyltransferase [Firmicutes bacterium]|nr:GNAT family N-acetyltransferase [Bacillota bacterium]
MDMILIEDLHKHIPKAMTLNNLDFRPMTEADLEEVVSWGDGNGFFSEAYSKACFSGSNSYGFNYGVFDMERLAAQFYCEGGCNYVRLAIKVNPQFAGKKYASRITDGFIKMLQQDEAFEGFCVRASANQNNEYSRRALLSLGFEMTNIMDLLGNNAIDTFEIPLKDYRTPPALARHNEGIIAQNRTVPSK